MTRTLVLPCLLLASFACDSTTIVDVFPDGGEFADLGPGDQAAGDTGQGDGGAHDGGALEDPCGADAPTGDPQITIGTGLDVFQPVCQGDSLSWVAGMQGSHHLEGAVRLSPEVVAGLSAEERTEIEHEYRVSDAQTSSRATEIRDLDDGGLPFPLFEEGPDGSLQTLDIQLVIDRGFQGGDPNLASGRTLIYQVFVELPDGTRYQQTVEIESTCCS